QVAVDLAKMPKAPDKDVVKAREALERLESVGRLVPVLERFRGCRANLAEEARAEKQADQTMPTARQRGEKRKAEMEILGGEAGKAAGALRQATIAAAEARPLAQQSRQSLEDPSQLEGAKVCRHCAQPLTPGHIEEEKKRRGRETKQAEERAKAAAGALQK